MKTTPGWLEIVSNHSENRICSIPTVVGPAVVGHVGSIVTVVGQNFQQPDVVFTHSDT